MFHILQEFRDVFRPYDNTQVKPMSSSSILLNTTRSRGKISLVAVSSDGKLSGWLWLVHVSFCC